VLQNNGGDNRTTTVNGSFVFATRIPPGESYDVRVLTQPANQTCFVSNGSGTALATVNNVTVSCLNNYTVGGSVSGVVRPGLVLQNNGGDDLSKSADGNFVFATTFEVGVSYNYNVSVKSNPLDQSCSVTGGSGVATSTVTNVSVSCIDPLYTVGGAVTGLAGSGLVLQNNGGDNLSITSTGGFTFHTPLDSRVSASYNVTVASQPAGQTCTVNNGNGTATDDITNVTVSCLDNFVTIGGTVSYLSGTGLVLQNNGGDNLTINANGSFQFPTPLERAVSDAYGVTVLSQPLPQTCTVTNGSGNAGGDVTNVDVTCFDAAPQLTLGVDIKQLSFSWNPVLGATHYKMMVNTDGASGFVQLGDDLVSVGLVINVRADEIDWNNSQYMLSACDASSCQDSSVVYTAGEILKAIGYFKASNTDGPNAILDQFGYAVALSDDGNTLAVSAPQEDSIATGINGDEYTNDDPVNPPTDCSTNGTVSGAVYLFTRGASGWVQQAYIKPSNTMNQMSFGYSLSLSADGDVLAVGATGEMSSSKGINQNQNSCDALGSGAVYIFNRSGTGWSQKAYIKASDSAAGYAFGSSVSLSDSGTSLAVGAPFHPGVSWQAGAAYVFTGTGSSWSEKIYITPPIDESGLNFGQSVSLSGDGATLAVGAPGRWADAYNSAKGAVYIYAGSSWSKQADIYGSNTVSGSRFGKSVALSSNGNTLSAVAAGFGGGVYIFSRSGSSWSEQAILPREGTLAMSGDGNAVAVGNINDNGGGTDVRGDPADYSAMRSGAVYLYTWNGTSWSSGTYFKATNTDADDSFGNSVALSADGKSLAVGAILEMSVATGIGGDQTDNSIPLAGAVYLY
jgi:hypothetical protein